MWFGTISFNKSAADEGLVRLGEVPASQVTLHPFLLGEKFQRIADKAVLRKNGVKKSGTDELKK